MALRIWPRSLIARILMAELGTILFVAILLPTLMAWLLHQQMDRYQFQVLAEQAREIGRGIEIRGNQLVIHLKPDLGQTYATPYDGRSYVIIDAAGQARSQSAFAHLVPWHQAPRGDQAKLFRIDAIIGVSRPIRVGTTTLWIVVTQDEAGRGAIIDDVAHAFLMHYAPVLLLILLLLPLINSLLIRRLVVRVRSVSTQAGAIGAKTLNARLEESGLPQEITPLVKAINGLLERLQQSFQQQSQFVANVAHELRTPLTTLKFQIEAVEDNSLRDLLQHRTDQLGHVIAQLQALAALEVTDGSFTSFDAVALARDVVGDIAPQILANGDTIALEAPDQAVMIRANRTLIALALSNLIVNATRHTPQGTSICVKVSTEGAFEVADNGPGIASSDPELSKLRYWRADTRRSDSAGLGLSIVSRIMEVHEGRLTIENQPHGGARFVLTPK